MRTDSTQSSQRQSTEDTETGNPEGGGRAYYTVAERLLAV